MYRPRTPAKERFEEKAIPEPNTGCWIWTGFISNAGYGLFRIDPKANQIGAHRAAWLLYRNTEIPEGMQVCHKCDNRYCVNPDHLFLGTSFDNMRDAARKGRMQWSGPRALPSGEDHHAAKLRVGDVIDIRASNELGTVLARRYGVSTITISRIRRRIIWRSVA